jgi:hypothetical protein
VSRAVLSRGGANRSFDFQSIRTEGGRPPPDLLQRIAEADLSLQGLTAESYHLDPGMRLGEASSGARNRLLGAWAAFDASRSPRAALPAPRTATHDSPAS